MQVVILCSEMQKAELGAVSENLEFVETIQALVQKKADVFVDLLYEDHAAAHRPLLEGITDGTIIAASLIDTSAQLPAHFIRINAWPTFLQGALIEACGTDDHAKKQAAVAFAQLGKTLEWVPDVPGMISARVIASIINEAYFALSENVASKKDMDTAMKLGTAYPYGPFEWAGKIGIQRVVELLRNLAQEESRYAPCALLEEEVVSSEW